MESASPATVFVGGFLYWCTLPCFILQEYLSPSEAGRSWVFISWTSSSGRYQSLLHACVTVMAQYHIFSKWLCCHVCDLLMLGSCPTIVLGKDVCGHIVDPGRELA